MVLSELKSDQAVIGDQCLSLSVIKSVLLLRLDWCDPGVWRFTQPLQKSRNNSQWPKRLKTQKNLPGLRLVPFFGKLPHESPKKIWKSGNEGVLSWGRFSHFSSWEKHFPVVESGFWGHISYWLGVSFSWGGLRFSFQALEVPEPRVRKRPFYLLKWPFPHSRVRAQTICYGPVA